MQQAKVTIKGNVETRYITTKQGAQKPVYSQLAQLETEAMRVSIEVEVDGPQSGYPVGQEYLWDLAADIVPGRFGPELARRKTLLPAKAAAAAGR